MRRLLMITLVAVISCDQPVAPPDVEVASPLWATKSVDADLDLVTEWLAPALSNSRVRSDLRDAMRSSGLTEHKIIFQEYLKGPAGQHLIRMARSNHPQAATSMGKVIAGLPELDFYVPFVEHRLEWKATDDVLLGGVSDPDEFIIRTYSADGGLQVINTKEGAPDEALLLLHPAEEKGPRINPQPDDEGLVIQDPGDGQMSGRIIWEDKKGNRRVIELADLVGGNQVGTADHDDCNPETSVEPCHDPGGGGGGSPSDTTFLSAFFVYFDDGGPGSSEVEWRSEHSNGAKHTLRLECVGCSGGPDPAKPWIMMFERIKEGSSQDIWTEVWETDAFVDDYYGFAIFDDSDNGVYQETHAPCGDVYDETTCNSLYGGTGTLVVASEFKPEWTPLF